MLKNKKYQVVRTDEQLPGVCGDVGQYRFLEV